MSSRKLTFEEWREFSNNSCNYAASRGCDIENHCSKCDFDYNPKTAWNFCLAQEKRENDELKKKVEVLEQENEALKKKLSEEVEVIKFYGNPEKWINRHKGSWDKCSPKNFGDEEAIAGYAHPRTDWIGTVVVGGKMARAFLKENKDELQNN